MDERGLQPDIAQLIADFPAKIAALRAKGEPPVDASLRTAVVDGPTDRLVATLGRLDETARADLFASSGEWLDEASASPGGTWNYDVLGLPYSGAAHARAGLAWLAIAPKSPLCRTIRKRRFLFDEPPDSAQVLLDRDPPWLDDLVGRIVAAASCRDEYVVRAFDGAVPMVLDWVARGVVARPEGAGWLGVVQVAGREEVAADPHILEHELYDSLTVPMPDGLSWSGRSLHGVAAELACEGSIDAGRYADALLAAAATTGERWAVELANEVLDLDGAAARISAYAALAVADIGRIPTFTQLDALDRAGRLPPEVAATLGPAQSSPTAKWAGVATRIIAAAAVDGPRAPDARLALAEGLSSPHDKVVTAAAAALAGLTGAPDGALRRAVAARVAELRPDQRLDLQPVLAAYLDGASGTASGRPGSTAEAGKDEVAAWTEADRSTFGIDAVLDAWRDRTPVPPLALDHRRLPVCTEDRAAAVIADADELARLFLDVIGRNPTRATFDRLIDGVHRFAGTTPSDDLLDELRRRYGRGFPEWEGWARGIARLAGCWVDDADLDYMYPTGGLIDGRLLAAAARTRSGLPGPALATPTHEGGWIDPRVLAERLDELHGHDLPAPDADVAAAILRVAPDPTGALAGCRHPLAATFAAAAADAPDIPDGDVPGLTKRGGWSAGPLDPAEALRFRAWAMRHEDDGEPSRLAALNASGTPESWVEPEDLPSAAPMVAAWRTSLPVGRPFTRLADPDLVVTAKAHAALAQTLCRSKDVAAAGAEVLLGAIESGRLNPVPFADALVALQANGEPAFTRFAPSAMAAAGRGAGEADAAQRVLERLLLGEWPRSPGVLLDGLRATVIASGRRPSPACREQIEARSAGSTKTAKQCRALLDLRGSDRPTDATYQLALEARIARARRFGAGD